ncbi:beta strand repeat-containing protein [Luteolibacter soli]|uniref:Autotransporter-associated beta strand repeat-containing protein n=1 Tax=Luteolibacter soli TaxID=3135280 RepID=A0ABU9B371_9BACT
MNNPTLTPITRASLLATASYNTRWFASLLAGTTVLGSAAFATTWDGTGTVVTDWNDNGNWVGDAGTGGSNAVIGINSPVATISANIAATPVDILVGDGAGLNGRVDHTAGTAQTGGGNWMVVGRGSGTGLYNLTGSGTGGTYTGRSQGSGTMNVSGRLYVGDGGGSVGTVNVHTTGTLAIGGEFNTGLNGGTATVNIDSGTVTNGGWLRVGAGSGGVSTLNISGGSVTKNGNDHMILGDNGGSQGTINLSAGTLNVNNECWIGQNGGKGTINLTGGTLTNNSWAAVGRANAASEGTVNHSGGTWNKTGGGHLIIGDNSKGTYNLSGTGALSINGEFWIGQGGSGNGTLTMSGGSITSNNWVAVGRENGTALVNMTGGTWTKTGGGTFIVGSSGPCTMNMSGGLVDDQGGLTWIGENGGATTATLNFSGTAEWRTNTMSVGQNTPNAILNLNGGTMKVQRFTGRREADDTGTDGGTGTINFNGTQIIATVNNPINFISTSVDNVNIDSGGLLVNTNGFSVVAPKPLPGTGGVVKSGAGTLTLSGVSSYGGNNSVQAGKLVLNGDSSGTGNITVANGAGLGVNQVNPANSLDPVAVTFGTSGTLDINLGNVAGNPTAAPLNVTGTLTVGGPITINVADQFPAVGSVPLISYVGPKAGGGSFVLGTLPNGVVANLVDNGTGLVSLNVTSASLPRWDGTNESGLTKAGDKVDGSPDITVANATGITIGQPVRGPGVPPATTVSGIAGLTITLSNPVAGSATGVNFLFVTTAGTNEGVWDFVTENWFDMVTNASSLYTNPSPVLFDDNATGPTAVTLNTTVTPSSVTFNNSSLTYSLSGTGKVTGSSGLTKSGSAALTVNNTNDYTGVTRLEGGITTVGTLTNGGVASPLGAASNAASNLVLAGGTLNYTGSATSTDRGVSLAAANNTIASGLVLASNLTVSGPITATAGKLVKTGTGSLTLTNAGANVLANGSGGETPQAFRFEEGSLVLNTAGQTNTVTGYAAFGVPNGSSSALTLGNGANLTVNGRLQTALGESSTSALTISGTSTLQVTDAVQIGLGNTSTSTVIIENSGTLNKVGGWFSLGHNSNTSTMTVRNSGTLSGNGDLNIGDTGSASGTLNLQDNATVSWAGGNAFVGKNGTTGNFNVGGDANVTVGETSVGGSGGSNGTLDISGTSNYISNGRLQVGPNGGSNGNVIIEGSGSMQVNSYVSVGFNGHGDMTIKGNGSFNNTDDFSVNENGEGSVTVNLQDNGALSMTRTLFIGRNGGKVGTLNVTGASTVTQLDAGYSLIVGPAGTGTLNMSGTSTVTAAANGGMLVSQGGGTGVVNLDGGTLSVKKVSDGGGSSTFHFNGGTLKANTGAALDFLNGIDTLDVKPGGAFIDSNGQTIAINQGIGDADGALTKKGAGTLQLNSGSNTYLGTTTVQAGALGGTGAVAGELVVQSGASIAPGAAGVGTFTVQDTLSSGSSIAGTYVCEINGATADQLAVAGDLNVTGATLDFDVLAAPSAPSYVIATYASITGTFAVVDLPPGCTLNYGPTQLTLVQSATPYSLWAQSYGLDPLTDGAPGFDKDKDGQVNSVEFALGGSPISGENNAKIYSLAADSGVDVDSNREAILTIAVRTGTPAFAGSPSPTATQDGYTYTIEGSTTLGTFTTVVTPTPTPVTAGLPAAPTGYEYRSFSLAGSNGVPTRGFMRVLVTP